MVHPAADIFGCIPSLCGLPEKSYCAGEDNVVYDMQDAGIAIIESFDADIHDNTFTNVKYGILISLGGGNNAVHGNVFDTCSKCESLPIVCGGLVSLIVFFYFGPYQSRESGGNKI